MKALKGMITKERLNKLELQKGERTMKTIIDKTAARELELYVMNDFRIYSRSLVPVRENMIKKIRKGTFDSEKAVKGFMYSVEYAAKLYCQDFGGIWYQVFNKATREAVATALLQDFLEDNT